MYFYFVYHHNYFILLLLLTLPKSNWCKMINTVMFIERGKYESYCMFGIISNDWNENVNHFLGGLKEETECSWKWEVPYTNKGMWLS